MLLEVLLKTLLILVDSKFIKFKLKLNTYPLILFKLLLIYYFYFFYNAASFLNYLRNNNNNKIFSNHQSRAG